jgi:hypothetical protein
MSTKTSTPQIVLPPAPASAQRTRVSRTGYWVAGLIAVLSVGGALAWSIPAFTDMRSTIDGFARVGVPGSVSIALPASTGQVIYYEGQGAPSLSVLQMEVTGPDGADVTAQSYDQNVDYDAPGNVRGHAVGTFETTVAGTYTISTHATASGSVVAVGDSIVGTDGWQVAAAVVLMIAGLPVAIIVTVVTAVRRQG